MSTGGCLIIHSNPKLQTILFPSIQSLKSILYLAGNSLVSANTVNTCGNTDSTYGAVDGLQESCAMLKAACARDAMCSSRAGRVQATAQTQTTANDFFKLKANNAVRMLIEGG